MAKEWEVPMAACCSTASVAASLIPPPNQNDSFMVAAASDDDQSASYCGLNFFSASVSCDSSFYSAPVESAVAGSSLWSSVFQAEQSSFDLYIPQCEDEAELEWLSRFMEESSFSDVEPAPPPPPSCVEEKPDVGRGARNKRPRGSPWSSLATNSPSSSSSSGEFSSDGAGRTKKGASPRRCTHCASENTPQWRTGPLGPKTLCNACGVRHKSGRLVPEYRPAASPTFVLTQHSNSHRKVMELRRQKELLLRHHP